MNVIQEPRGVHVPGDPGGARVHHGAQLPLHHQPDSGQEIDQSDPSDSLGTPQHPIRARRFR